MKCPNCSKEAADDAAECMNCGFVLAKWRAAQAGGGGAGAGAGGGTLGGPPRVRDSSAGSGVALETVVLFALLLLAAGYYWFFERTGAPYSGPSQALGRRECAFSGEVLDIYHLLPVGGVRLDLMPRAAAVSDAAGKFFIRVKPGKSYTLEVSHARFRPGYVDGFARDWRDATWEQRVHAARSLTAPPAEAQASAGEPGAPAPTAAPAAPPARAAEMECGPGEERVFNFAIVPKTVTGDEQDAIDKVQ